MYRSSVSEADTKIRAAHAALAERKRLTEIRAALAPDLAEAEADATKLEATLTDEQKDVRRYEKGVWAFLYDIFADRDARLTKEQREAAEAATRFQEAATMRDRLREELASLGARIEALKGADADLAAARAGKRVLVVASGGPGAAELEAITAQLGAIDAEGRAIDEALEAGGRAHTALTRLAETLGSARSWGAADILTDSFLVSWQKRQKLDEARNLAGVAQAEISVFRRELGDVGIALLAEVAVLADHHRFLDTWFDNIFSDFSVQGRITEAQTTTTSAITAIGGALDHLRSQRATSLTKANVLSKQQLELIEPE